MKVTMLLADAAQSVDGKLYILGGGWSLIGPDPVPSAIAVKIEVPWNQANRRHRWRLRLLDADHRPVTVTAPDGARPVEVSGDFEVGRPAGLLEGTPLDVPLAVNLGPLPLAPGHRYEWHLDIDGEQGPDWRVAFATRRAASPSGRGGGGAPPS